MGELNVGRAWFDVNEQVFGFFDYYLKGAKNSFPEKTPRVRYYTMGRNQWENADAWPPGEAVPTVFHLSSAGRANSLFGDGTLSTEAPTGVASDTFTYDPMNPVPSLGGGVCCNAGATLGGSFDQRAIEARADVLVYTSAPLDDPIQITGSVYATLYVSSDAKDTDFTVKLVDVHPDGTPTISTTPSSRPLPRRLPYAGIHGAGQSHELKPLPCQPATNFKGPSHSRESPPASFRNTCGTSIRGGTTTTKPKAS